MFRIRQFTVLATVWTAISAGGYCLATSQADTRESFRSQTAVHLIALLPSSANVAWWIFPTTGARAEDRLSTDMVVIGQRWILDPGVSLNVHCTAVPADGQVAELVSLDPADGMNSVAALLPKSGPRSITLATVIGSRGWQHTDMHTLLMVHNGSKVNPTVIHIIAIAL